LNAARHARRGCEQSRQNGSSSQFSCSPATQFVIIVSGCERRSLAMSKTTIKTIIFCAFFAILSINVNTANGQDTTDAEGLLKIADEFRSRSDPDSAIVYYEKSAIEFNKNGNTEKTINSYNQIGTILNRQDKYEKAKTYLEKALAIGLSSNTANSLAIATTYITLGVTYGAENQFEQSLIYHNKALSIRLLKLGKYSSDVATSYGNIGNVYFRKKDYDKSIEAHLNAKQIREKIFGKNSTEAAQSYTFLGNAYKEKKSYKKSLNYYKKALVNKIEQLGQGHKDLVRYYKNVGEIYSLMGDKLRSDEYRIKAEEIEKRSK
jgi:tetratricopeptide (TPR) repeat protein